MIPIEIPHPGFKRVGEQMREAVARNSSDMAFTRGWSMQRVFEYIEALPYLEDSMLVDPQTEVIGGPRSFVGLPGIDCKKKAVMVACWARENGIPWHFVAVDDTGLGISHVFAEVFDSGQWVSMDCTIRGIFKPGSAMPTVERAVLI